MALRVGLLATLLSSAQSYRGAGIHTYSRQLLEHLPHDDQRQFLALLGDQHYQPPGHVRVYRTRWNTLQPPQRILWEQMFLPVIAARERLDVLHGLGFAVPIASSIPRVVTVHDLSFLLFPDNFRPFNRFYLSRITALSCRASRRVIAVSAATAADLSRLLGVDAGKIDVIYNGIDNVFQPLPPEQVAAHRQQAGWPEQFILTVSTLEPRKNHLTLLDAYARYRRMSAQPLPLIIAGGKGWYWQEIFQRLMALQLQSHVHFLGFVAAEDLPWLYNAATLFVFPSRYEGFGMPLAEAMACGAPAITSTASSLPEVAGPAAVLVSPDDSEALAIALFEILNNPARQTDMRQAGLEHVAQFRWPRTVSSVLQVYARISQHPDA